MPAMSTHIPTAWAIQPISKAVRRPLPNRSFTTAAAP